MSTWNRAGLIGKCFSLGWRSAKGLLVKSWLKIPGSEKSKVNTNKSESMISIKKKAHEILKSTSPSGFCESFEVKMQTR